jgi:hypothetical protein
MFCLILSGGGVVAAKVDVWAGTIDFYEGSAEVFDAALDTYWPRAPRRLHPDPGGWRFSRAHQRGARRPREMRLSRDVRRTLRPAARRDQVAYLFT